MVHCYLLLLYLKILFKWLNNLLNLIEKDFKAPKKPFKRMPYTEAIEYLKQHNITKDDGTFYEFGDVRTYFKCNFM